MVLDEIIPLHISDIFSQVYVRVFFECVGVDLNHFLQSVLQDDRELRKSVYIRSYV